ncbi:MAG: homogentisate 1,2-dioxygenase [Planctomycetia bacterium]|nr:homogentisate 1,2-dioxygenase [Planctomycetia bacterium]
MTDGPLAPNIDPPTPNIDLYSRNGFLGPFATIVKANYGPDYQRVVGTYAPYLLNTSRVSSAKADGRELPQALLVGQGVSVEIFNASTPAAFALRNVLCDEVLYVLRGSGSLDTDLGVLAITEGDFVMIPRALSYRVAQVQSPLSIILIATRSTLKLEPEGFPGVLNTDIDVHVPQPYSDPVGPPGEYEVVIRHGENMTSYFYERDPLRCIATVGPPQIRRFSIDKMQAWGIETGGIMPPRIINDPTSNTLFFYIGTRRSDRPPIHHNADYDEIIVYAKGPHSYGALDEPGLITWVPQGIVHHGPEEDTPTPYKAWLMESRSPLTLTLAGRQIAKLMETSLFGTHSTAT